MKLAREGKRVPKRTCPTAAEYLEAQKENERVGKEAKCGLYERYYLVDYHNHLESKDDWSLPPKQWHGSPMAAIIRTFQLLGVHVLFQQKIPEQQLLNLQELQGFYRRPNPSTTIITQDRVEHGQPGNDSGPGDANFGGSEQHQDGPNPNPSDHNGTAHNMNLTLQPSKPSNVMDRDEVSGLVDSAVDVQPTGKENIQPMEEESVSDVIGKKSISEEDFGRWGPDSSSSHKAEWYPQMMGWDRLRRERQERDLREHHESGLTEV